jgi:hypothetical protein
VPRPDTWSDRARPGKLQHHSARGNMPRNAGDFTRGSQLITHEFMMWFASAKMPLLVWFFTFLVALSIVLALLLHEHEVQMILMRIYAAGWSFMEFNPRKILNLTLPSGRVIPAPVSMIASHPDVVIAWNKLMRAIWGSLFISLFVAVPIAVWFVDFSKRRGKSILEERHQRGAMLVDGPELAAVINAHNRDMLDAEVAHRLPGKTLRQVLALPLVERKAAGIHHAYSMADVPFPWRTEQAHTIMIGSTGTGKTTQMRALIAQMRVRRDRAVVFDLTGAYVEAFYNPETDTILNPMDERCPSWSVFAEAKNHADFTGIAAALLPADGGGAEPFWMLAARTLFVETCIKLIKLGEATNQALASRLMMADLKEVHKLLEHTVADPLTAPEAAKMAESIRAVFNTNAQALAVPARRQGTVLDKRLDPRRGQAGSDPVHHLLAQRTGAQPGAAVAVDEPCGPHADAPAAHPGPAHLVLLRRGPRAAPPARDRGRLANRPRLWRGLRAWHPFLRQARGNLWQGRRAEPRLAGAHQADPGCRRSRHRRALLGLHRSPRSADDG